MQLNLGTKIRQLRHRDGRTQETLAEVLGVTSQAVSRWESGGSYPDIEIMPAIANYFGVTIDELFGYQNDREAKIDTIIQKVAAFDIQHDTDDQWVEECLSLLRAGLAEFPTNERLLITLADTLWEAGWRRNTGGSFYDTDGYIHYSYDREKTNQHWAEARKICEYLLENATDHTIYSRAIAILIPLLRNYGETDKAIFYAKQMPGLQESQEYLLTEATDGKLGAEYIASFLIKTAKEFSEQLVNSIISNNKHFDSDHPIHQITAAIALFDQICDDGNIECYHEFVSKLYLYLSALQWHRGYRDSAFDSLNQALSHAQAYESLNAAVVENLSTEWPFWTHPYTAQISMEIQKDPRWNDWVLNTRK
jgi:transcriptional regulator with XRE-family HTH domain